MIYYVWLSAITFVFLAIRITASIASEWSEIDAVGASVLWVLIAILLWLLGVWGIGMLVGFYASGSVPHTAAANTMWSI